MPDTQFSILLPVRNGGAYVRECVRSILAQTWSRFTLLVLDNNSTDGTPEWISSLGDDRITLYRSAADLSIEANWMRAVDLPKGTFITLIGHDDLLHPCYLQGMADLIIAHPAASLYQAHFNFIDAAGQKMRACRPMKSRYSAAEFLEGEFLQTIDSMGTGYMMRSTDFDAAGGMTLGYPRLIFADYALWVKLAAKGYLAVSPDCLFSYRLHNSVSKLTNGEDYQQAFGVYVHFLAGLRRQDTEVAAVLDRYGKRFLDYFTESLAHRLLKTPLNERQTSVRAFVDLCRNYATLLIPGQDFQPSRNIRVKLAEWLDNPPGILLFRAIKKITGGS